MQSEGVFRIRITPVVIIILTMLLFTLAFGSASAQGVVGYGTPVAGNINAAAPAGFFTFSGTAGDLVSIRVISTSGGLDPNVSLLSSSQQQLASNDNDPFSPGSRNASISVRLPETGPYSLLVGGSNGTAGDFLLMVDALAPAVSTALTPDLPTVVNIPLGAPSQSYSFAANPGGPTTINLSTDTPDFGFTAAVRDATGQVVAVLAGSSLQRAALTLGPATGVFEVMVSSSSPDTQGAVTISLGGGTSGGQTAAPPAATQEAAAPPPVAGADPLAGVGPDAACIVTPGGNANLRAGAGTNFPVQGQLLFGQTSNPDGQAFGGDGFVWYRLPNGAWVRSDVVRTAGNCAGLPTVQSPAAPVGPPPPQQTQEPGAPPPPQQTQDPGGQPPPPTTAPPPANPTAPADTAQYFLDVGRDQNGQFSEQVSYPEGDTQDQVWFRITDLLQQPPNNNREYSFTVTCSGTGTENLRWGKGVNTNQTCGSSVTGFFTDDNDQQLFTISITGGGPSLVNWTLIATKIG